MIKKEELYELVIEDENIDGIFAISLVQDPAIEADFVYFDKEKVQFSAVDNEQRLVMGAILIPNKKILRIDGEGKPYHVFFKPETIKRLSEMYLKNKYTDKATLEHNQKINGVTLVESWIKESASKDKSALYNLNAPVGSWLGTFKIDNDKIWNDYVKTGDVKGFSIEGLFGHSLVSANEMFNLEKDISLFSEVEAEILLEKIKEVLEAQPSIASSYPGEGPTSGSVIAPATFEDVKGNINVYGLDTEYFYMCPGAIETFTHLQTMDLDEDTIGMVRSAALVADRVFDTEEDVIENQKASPKDLGEAITLVRDFKDIMKEVDDRVGMQHDVSYMDGHIKTIKSYL